MKIVVDTNILLSMLISKNSKFRDILFDESYQFYSCHFLILEIFKHKEKIIKYSKMDENELLEFLYKILNKITFINENIIELKNRQKAFELCSNIDINDIPFVALTFELNAFFWTGDKKLKNHLKKKGINFFFEF